MQEFNDDRKEGDQDYSRKLKQHVHKLGGLSNEEEVMEAYRSMQKTGHIDTEAARRNVWSGIGRNSGMHKLYDRFARVAAILVFPLLLLAVWGIIRQKPASTELVSQEVTVPAGIRTQIVLPDSTRVWLNSGSKLRYSIPFVHGSRQVSLSGEAYFEVAHDPANPFSVMAGNSKVEVLGTSFNIKAYEEEPEVQVVLVEGKLLFMAGQEADGISDVVLSPGERAVYGKEKGITVDRDSPEKYAAWRFGKLVFDETPMEEVARNLERWFGVQVIVSDPRLNAYKFTTTFENQSLQQVLEMLELSSNISTAYQPVKFDSLNHMTEPAKVYFGFQIQKNKQ